LFAWRWWCLSLICARDPAPAPASLVLRSRDTDRRDRLSPSLLDLPRSPGYCLARDRPAELAGTSPGHNPELLLSTRISQVPAAYQTLPAI
jgi:hypothetical protein